ncbi:N-acetylneuraminate synthase family protein [Achromobacter xylosoxidans]|uniref:N-acetylneuraminate synthase family protein n=1 Tax=Alcaligenes xylosoxydans xylosoxydans TaxID=85698 RepID=UPI0024029122|nr:N-acetylneuraminate synthase family protein [Achromobacter xylosoxidans]
MSTYVIAEAGVNHNGSLDMAKRLIDAAADAGVDAVKFQTFSAAKLVAKHAPKADYQKRTTDAQESQYEMIKRLELSENDHDVLLAYARSKDIEFLSTPFDSSSLLLLTERFGISTIKVSSGDITNAPLSAGNRACGAARDHIHGHVYLDRRRTRARRPGIRFYPTHECRAGPGRFFAGLCIG